MKLHPHLRRNLLALSATLLATAASSHAALVTWAAPQTISGDSDVSTVGTLAVAVNLGPIGVSATTINGVNFLPLGQPTGTPTSSVLPLSANYLTLLNSGLTLAADSPVTFTINGLTIGDTYLFQTWVNNSDRDWSGFNRGDFPVIVSDGLGSEVRLYPGDNGLGVGPADSNLPPTLGQYVTGTFTADATTQDFVFLSEEVSGVVNGLQLRNITAAPAVPEPGTALAGLAALGLIASRRRRQG